MPGYQTFPYQPGSSDPLSKLTQLKIPALTAKKFFDVGAMKVVFMVTRCLRSQKSCRNGLFGVIKKGIILAVDPCNTCVRLWG